jgi:NTP pyrophosphatase (non-canonical NTP hydrolase)
MSDDKIVEQDKLLIHLAQECAELIQEITKAQMYGFDSKYQDKTNRTRLIQEAGDVLALLMVISLRHGDILPAEELEKAVSAKIVKLRRGYLSLKDFDLDQAMEDATLGI